MTTITRTDRISAAAALEATADTSALTAAILWGLTAPTKQELAELWTDASPDTAKKRRSRAAAAAKRWDEAHILSPDTIAPIIAAFDQGGDADTITQAAKVAAALTGVVLDSALTLADWLEALAEHGGTLATGKASESVAKLTGARKQERAAAKRAPRQPKAPTATTKGAKSAPEIAATEAGAHRPATTVDSASSEDAAAADATTTAMLAAIEQAIAMASAAPDAATAAAIMAAQWAKSVGVTLPQ